MKTNKRILSWTAACCMTAALTAQTVNVSPIPQRIVWGDKAFDQPKNIVIKGAEDADADTGQLAVGQILVCFQLNNGFLASLENNLIGINFMGVALEVIGIETHLDVLGPIAAQGVDLHIQHNIGLLLLFTGFC